MWVCFIQWNNSAARFCCVHLDFHHGILYKSVLIFKTKEEFLEHNKIVHENLDHILTEEEFDNLSSVNSYCLRNGQRDTPKSKDAEKKKDLRERSLRLKQKKLNI